MIFIHYVLSPLEIIIIHNLSSPLEINIIRFSRNPSPRGIFFSLNNTSPEEIFHLLISLGDFYHHIFSLLLNLSLTAPSTRVEWLSSPVY